NFEGAKLAAVCPSAEAKVTRLPTTSTSSGSSRAGRLLNLRSRRQRAGLEGVAVWSLELGHLIVTGRLLHRLLPLLRRLRLILCQGGRLRSARLRHSRATGTRRTG